MNIVIVIGPSWTVLDRRGSGGGDDDDGGNAADKDEDDDDNDDDDDDDYDGDDAYCFKTKANSPDYATRTDNPGTLQIRPCGLSRGLLTWAITVLMMLLMMMMLVMMMMIFNVIHVIVHTTEQTLRDVREGGNELLVHAHFSTPI